MQYHISYCMLLFYDGLKQYTLKRKWEEDSKIFLRFIQTEMKLSHYFRMYVYEIRSYKPHLMQLTKLLLLPEQYFLLFAYHGYVLWLCLESHAMRILCLRRDAGPLGTQLLTLIAFYRYMVTIFFRTYSSSKPLRCIALNKLRTSCLAKNISVCFYQPRKIDITWTTLFPVSHYCVCHN